MAPINLHKTITEENKNLCDAAFDAPTHIGLWGHTLKIQH